MKKRIHDVQDLFTENAYDITYQEYNDLSFDPRLVNDYKLRYGVKTNVAPECIACQIGHIEKYKGTTDDHGNVITNPLSHLTCKFIPKSYALPEKIASQLTPVEQNLLEIVRDPVAWAKYYLGWEAREYQKTTLRCTAKHTVHRWGRRSGKTEQCAVEILWFTFTQTFQQGTSFSGEAITTGPKTMIVTPYLSQIQMVFEKISALLARNKDLEACMTRFVKTPNYRMEFSNGGVITGFTTGSKSKGEGASLRGQGAHKLYLDECDYMEDADYKAILPILHEAADRSIIASSTPTGKRERFYGWCKKKPHWKEFYFPATCLPDWPRIEGDVLAETSEVEFQQEYMADFIARDIGVYQPNYVSTAVTNPPFEYSSIKRDPSWIYAIGVDWGDKVGTEIVVTGMDPRGHIWLVDAINVTKQGWTQMASMEAVINMNRKWRPKYVYVDDGYGGTQVEILRATALKAMSTDDPTKDLIRTLKAYNFSAKIPIRDPASGTVIKKPAKDFMVQNSVRRFEEGVIHIPKDDNIIYKQLINYIVERINQSGVRIYGQSNAAIGDHRLDALNLALVSYKLEMSAFSLDGGMSSIVRHAGMLGEHYAQHQVQDNAPFAADIRYPEGYMKYNIDTGDASHNSPKSRGLEGEPGKNGIVAGKPVYTGSVMKEMKQGFMSDTEHMHAGKQRMNKVMRKSTASVLPSRTSLGGPWKR